MYWMNQLAARAEDTKRRNPRSSDCILLIVKPFLPPWSTATCVIDRFFIRRDQPFDAIDKSSVSVRLIRPQRVIRPPTYSFSGLAYFTSCLAGT